MKVSKAPKNFYSASTAAKRLGLSKTTFHEYVRKGKIKKVVPPGSSEGYYPKKDIDQMVREKQLFILEYASEPSLFRKATEEDLHSIHNLQVHLFGFSQATPYETLEGWYQQNPETYYILTQEDIVIGYVGFLYLDEQTTRHIMAAAEPGVPVPDATHVLPFTPGKAIDGLWVGLGVLPGLSQRQSTYTGMHLLTGAIEVLENLAKRDMPVRKLYATSQTTDGTRLSRKLQFKEIKYPHESLIRYELDLETTDLSLAKEYQAIVAQRSKRMPKLSFVKATPEKQSGEFELAVLNFGERAEQLNGKRIDFLQKNPDMTYYLYDGEMLVSSINLLPLQHEGILKFKEGERGWLLEDYIEQYTPGKALELIIIDFMTTTLSPENKRKQYAQRLLSELTKVFVEWAHQGVEVAKIYACGSTPDGRQILEGAKFQYLGEPRTNRHIYELDVPSSSLKALKLYKKSLAEYKVENI